MSQKMRKWLSTSDIAELTGYTRRHVTRLALAGEVGNFDTTHTSRQIRRRGRNYRFADTPDLRSWCSAQRIMLSIPSQPGRGSRMSRAFAEIYKHEIAAFAEAIVFADEPEVVETIWSAFLEGTIMELIKQNSHFDKAEVIDLRNAARRYLAAIIAHRTSGRSPFDAVLETPDFDTFLQSFRATRDKMESGANRQEQLYDRLAKQDLVFGITDDGDRD
jgi:hypothetical protein